MKRKIGIIGAGNIAALFDTPESDVIMTHAHAIQSNAYAELIGFYDIDPERAKQAAKRWQTRVFSSIEELVCRADIVYVCVPDEFHYAILKQIGTLSPKLVMAEKPITTTVQEAQYIRENFERKHIPVVLNYTRRFIPEFQALKEECKSYGRFLKGVGYYGKGALHNGSHMVDLLFFLLGSGIFVERASHGMADFSEDDKSADIMLSVAGGIFQMIAVDCRLVSIFECELFFEKKRVRILENGKIIEKYDVAASPDVKGYVNYRLCDKISTSLSPVAEGLLDNCIAYLERKSGILCGIEDGIRVLEINEEIRKLLYA